MYVCLCALSRGAQSASLFLTTGFYTAFWATHCHPKAKEIMVGSTPTPSGVCLTISLRLLYIFALAFFFVHTSMFIVMPTVGRCRPNGHEQASPHRVSSSDIHIFHLHCGSTSMRHSTSEHNSEEDLIQRDKAEQVSLLFRKCRSL